MQVTPGKLERRNPATIAGDALGMTLFGPKSHSQAMIEGDMAAATIGADTTRRRVAIGRSEM